jgi:membrane protein required for colicin V production
MTALDILFLLIVGGAGFFGFQRGFTTEILSLGAWFLAIAAVKMLHGPVSAGLTSVVGTAAGAAVLALSLIFGLTMFAGKLIARQVGNQSKQSSLGLFDRALGLGFGALKGLIVSSLVFLFASLIFNTIHSRRAPRPDWMTQSKSYALLSASSKALVDLVEERQNVRQPKAENVVTAGD